jgi:hypothetical protein
MKVILTIALIATMITKGCNDKIPERQTLPIVNGVYEGVFTLTSPNGTFTGNTTLELNNNRFVASGNSNRIPAGGSGNFHLSADRQKITFQDENFWTADFDWSLILTGKFEYSFDGEMLEFTRSNDDGSTVQRYQLTKI